MLYKCTNPACHPDTRSTQCVCRKPVEGVTSVLLEVPDREGVVELGGLANSVI